MKLAKIFVPIAAASLLVMVIIMWVVFAMGAIVPDVEGGGADALGAGLAAVFGSLIIIVINVAATLLFGGFALGLFICWICLFKGRNKFGALTGALVLACLIVPAVVIAAIITAILYFATSPIGAVIVLLGLALYLAAFIGLCVAYGKVNSLRKKELTGTEQTGEVTEAETEQEEEEI